MRRNSQKGIALLLLVHSLGLLLSLIFVGRELFVLFPKLKNTGAFEFLILMFLDHGLGWLLLGMAFQQYLRKVNKEWQGEGFRGRILFQLYPAYYLLEFFRLYGAKASLGHMGFFYYLFLILFVLLGGFSAILYMVRSTEKPLEEGKEESGDGDLEI